MRARRAGPVDLGVSVGSVALPTPVMTASGTAGHGAELAAYGDLAQLGAVVVKSLCAGPWAGNPAPRVHNAGAGMLNSVGLQGPGVVAWLGDDLPGLAARGARVVVSLWGRSIEDFARAATALAEGLGAGAAEAVVAVEVNVSCPNVEDRSHMFAHSPEATRAALGAVVGALAEIPGAPGRRAASAPLPCWAKLSPNVADVTEIAAAALDGGAAGLTLVNTLLGMAVDLERRSLVLGAGGGGLSGPPVHPVAVRAVYECRAAFPNTPIVGVGGVGRGADAVELLMAGADAVQVGTATFADPRAAWRVTGEIERWCRRHHVRAVRELRGAAHAR